MLNYMNGISLLQVRCSQKVGMDDGLILNSWNETKEGNLNVERKGNKRNEDLFYVI